MIYLIKCDKTQSCKIGYSANPENRLIQLQTGNPFPLQILAVKEGDLFYEKELHTKFKHLKLQGEWFEFNNEIENYFEIKNPLLKWATIINSFDHIGEAKLYSYILLACNNNKEDYYLHHDKSAQTIAKELKIAPPTQFKYLSLLVKKELLIKEIGKRGYYRINPKFIS